MGGSSIDNSGSGALGPFLVHFGATGGASGLGAFFYSLRALSPPLAASL